MVRACAPGGRRSGLEGAQVGREEVWDSLPDGIGLGTGMTLKGAGDDAIVAFFFNRQFQPALAPGAGQDIHNFSSHFLPCGIIALVGLSEGIHPHLSDNPNPPRSRRKELVITAGQPLRPCSNRELSTSARRRTMTPMMTTEVALETTGSQRLDPDLESSARRDGRNRTR